MKSIISCSVQLITYSASGLFRWKLLWTLGILFAWVPALAATANGFVTKIDSPTAFDVGKLHVAFNAKTHCEARTLPVLKLAYNLWAFNMPHYPSPIVSKTIKPMSTASISCDARHLSVGSWIYLVGFVQSDGKFAANSVVTSTEIPSKALFSGALLEETPELRQSAQGWNGTLWLDGYPMAVSSQTKLLAAPATTTFDYRWRSDYLLHSGFTVHIAHSKLHSKNGHPAFSAKLLRANTCVTYHAKRQHDASILATRLLFWPNQVDAKQRKFLKMYLEKAVMPKYNEHVDGSIQYQHLFRGTIKILPDQTVQDWVSRLGIELVPQYQRYLPTADASKINFQFLVVRPSPILKHLEFVNGLGRHSYHNVVIAMPNGTVLIPENTLTNIRNEGQLAAILSFAITSIVQKYAYMEDPVGKSVSVGIPSIYAYSMWQGEQEMRIGIRQMYLARYDIREAPFAWAVAQGKPVNNPVINSKDPDKEIPWYAAYAFNYISQYYKDVDYSKLKRGRKEYQQFLQELRKADPEAFASQKADSKPAVKVH